MHIKLLLFAVFSALSRSGKSAILLGKATVFWYNGNRPMHLDNSHTIEIEADGLLIRMSNEIKPLLLKMLMDTLKESLC